MLEIFHKCAVFVERETKPMFWNQKSKDSGNSGRETECLEIFVDWVGFMQGETGLMFWVSNLVLIKFDVPKRQLYFSLDRFLHVNFLE